MLGVISFIVPTIGRDSLEQTVASIELRPGDEVLLVGASVLERRLQHLINKQVHFVPCPPGGDWGHTERNVATPHARGRYIAHIDDDDVYAPGTRNAMDDAIRTTPGRPVLFRMQYPNGITLWQEPTVRCGNVGTPMFLIPNMPTRLGTWRPFVGGDCAFLEECTWKPEDYVWREEVIALLGHNT